MCQCSINPGVAYQDILKASLWGAVTHGVAYGAMGALGGGIIGQAYGWLVGCEETVCVAGYDTMVLKTAQAGANMGSKWSGVLGTIKGFVTSGSEQTRKELEIATTQHLTI